MNINVENDIEINKDFLIISYNEGSKNFKEKDCNEVISKVNNEHPFFIFICTQESISSGKTHYQHVLGELLKKIGYELLIKEDASVTSIAGLFKTNKNVRTRIYYKKNDKYSVLNISKKISEKAGLTKISESTIFKGSIFTKLIIKNSNNNEEIKLILVNSHLYFHASKSGNTGLSKREKEFISLLREFELANYYKEGYNIFYCGDLNFRLFNPKINNNLNSNEIIEMSLNIIEKINNGTNLDKQENYKNELYNIINKAINSQENTIIANNSTNNLFKKFYENAKKFGIHLTCKIHEMNGNSRTCHNKNQNGMFDCLHKNTARLPSMCDKILVANHNNLIIEKEDFKLLKDLRISDHFMISLTGKFV